MSAHITSALIISYSPTNFSFLLLTLKFNGFSLDLLFSVLLSLCFGCIDIPLSDTANITEGQVPVLPLFPFLVFFLLTFFLLTFFLFFSVHFWPRFWGQKWSRHPVLLHNIFNTIILYSTDCWDHFVSFFFWLTSVNVLSSSSTIIKNVTVYVSIYIWFVLGFSPTDQRAYLYSSTDSFCYNSGIKQFQVR